MNHTLINKKFRNTFSVEQLDQFCKITLDLLGHTEVDVTVVVETDVFIRNLNSQYRGIDEATDVLSFDIDHVDPETGRRYLGDIVISGDTVIKKTKELDITIIEETRLLIVHGLLHLFGYDHTTQAEEKVMWSKQDEIIISLKNLS